MDAELSMSNRRSILFTIGDGGSTGPASASGAAASPGAASGAASTTGAAPSMALASAAASTSGITSVWPPHPAAASNAQAASGIVAPKSKGLSTGSSLERKGLMALYGRVARRPSPLDDGRGPLL